MSRLINKLNRIRQDELRPIGFTLGKTPPQKTRLQLVAYLTADKWDRLSDRLNSVDAVLIEVNGENDISILEKACGNKNEVPVGGWLKTSNSETLKNATDSACDFLVFPGNVPLTVTREDKTGRILELDTSLNDRFLRTTSYLPIDAMLAFNRGDDNSLTLNRLMLFYHLVNMVNKPILVSIPDSITEDELQAICDTRIGGIVVELADKKSIERLAELYKVIEKLTPTPPAFHKKVRGSALVPRIQPEPEKTAQEDGGEEEDE